MDAVVGLGANIGDSLGTLIAAARQLGSIGQVSKISALYRTRPIGPSQPDFLNAAVLLSFPGEPEALLEALLEIERGHGRIREERWGPRSLDLDILWSPSAVVSTSRLTIPHPHLTERAFALVPLISIVPEARHPTTGVALAAYAARLDVTGVEPLLEPLWIRRLSNSAVI